MIVRRLTVFRDIIVFVSALPLACLKTNKTKTSLSAYQGPGSEMAIRLPRLLKVHNDPEASFGPEANFGKTCDTVSLVPQRSSVTGTDGPASLSGNQRGFIRERAVPVPVFGYSVLWRRPVKRPRLRGLGRLIKYCVL